MDEKDQRHSKCNEHFIVFLFLLFLVGDTMSISCLYRFNCQNEKTILYHTLIKRID